MDCKKLVIIGAGSAYTPEIFDELIGRRNTLAFEEISLVDTQEGMERASVILEMGRRMFQRAKLPLALRLTTDRHEALRGADFVMSQLRVGGYRARMLDEQTGLKLGILGQETTGAGGFMNAMRTIPVALGIAKDMERDCPKATLINFTNPSGMVTEAILKHSTIRCVGLCNVPINMTADAAKALSVAPDALHAVYAGLNHLSFMLEASVAGRDVMPELIEKIGDNETLMKNIPKVEGVGELIRALTLIPSPYLQYYYFEPQMLLKQQEEWKNSGTTRGASVHAINERLFEAYRDPHLCEKPPELSDRGGSLYSFAAVNIMEALLGDEAREMCVNVLNQGAIRGLPEDAGVEVNCMISKAGIRPVAVGPLPDKVAGLVKCVKQYESLTVEAAVEKSRTKAVQALLNQPLIHGYKNAVAVIEEMERLYPQHIALHV